MGTRKTTARRSASKARTDRTALDGIYNAARDALGILETVIHVLDGENDCPITSAWNTLDASRRGFDAVVDRLEHELLGDDAAQDVRNEILEALCIVELAAFALDSDYWPDSIKATTVKIALERAHAIIDAESHKLDRLAVGQKPDGSSERPAAEQRA